MNERGLSMEFVQVMHEAAEKTGFCISGIDKSSYVGVDCGAVIIRLVPKVMPQQNDEAVRSQLVPDEIVGR